MSILYLLLTLVLLLAFFGLKKSAIGLFFISLLLAIIWFALHATSTLNIQL